MPRNDQVTRILKTISLIENSSHGVSLKQILDNLESLNMTASERTVRRDLDAIEGAHFPLTKVTVDNETRWKIEPIARVNKAVNFNYQDLITLFIAKESLQTFKSSPLFQSINSLFDKIENALGQNVKLEMKELQKYIEYKPMMTWHTGISQEVLDTIHQAAAEGHVLKIQYKSNSGEFKNQIVERTVGPETIYFADSSVYLIGKDLNKNQYRFYAISRITNVEMSEEAYDSHDFNIDDFVKNNFGVLGSGELEDVILFIEDPLAAYVSERKWHESQVNIRKTGGIEMHFKVKVNDEFARWVLSLGASATVKQSETLKEHLRQHLEMLLSKYGSRQSAS